MQDREGAAEDTSWAAPEDAEANELPVQEPVLVKEHNAPGVHTEGCTPGPRRRAGRGGWLHWLHHA